MISETEIIRRIRQGDKGQFESLFRSSYVSLVRYAKTIINDHDTAEEIVQDLFVRLWQERQKLKIESSFIVYLLGVVHNRCLDWLDRTRVVEKYAREMADRETEKSESPVEIIQYNELQLKIAKVIERLPERCGQIFCMNRFEGFKYTEIAEKLSVSLKTVEANMGRALKEFRKALKET
jgi:RNA polymerase sigma-70 factor (ECF subfamily)